MHPIAEETRKMFNQQLNNLHAAETKFVQKTFLTLIKFGHKYENMLNYQRKPAVEVIYDNMPLASVAHLPTYPTHCDTPLWDATGLAVETLSMAMDGDNALLRNAAYIVMVLTDGQENRSSIYNIRTIKNVMSARQATDRWTITFLVPPGHKQSIVNLGVPAGNITEWEATTKGVETVSTAITNGFSGYYTARAAGKNKVNDFFTTDLSKVTSKDLDKLQDLSGRIKGWTVDKEVPIKEFIETHNGGEFFLGAAFYTLMKTETIQANKEIMVAEKGKKKVFGGKEARDLLKLPNYEVKVKPGNHAYFDIFVQSTSVNRKLVRGTRVLYRTDITAHKPHTW